MYPLTVICVNLLILGTDVVQARPYPKGMTLHKAALSWEDAHRTCQREGAVLASPTDDRMLYVMKSLMGEKNTTYFIGMKSAYYTAPFVSEDGVPLQNLTPAVMDMIDTIDQVDGDCLAMSSNSIRAVPCWSRLPFMCSNLQSLNMTLNYTNCGPDNQGYKYGKSHNKCYKFHGDLTWDEAEKECVKEGGHLFIAYSNTEARTVGQIFGSVIKNYVWAGIRDYNGYGDWKTVGGQRAKDVCALCNDDLPTGTALPKNVCVLLGTNLKYTYDYCTIAHPSICEKEPSY